MDFQYEQRSVPGPGTDPEDFEYSLEGCKCADTCKAENGCNCLIFGGTDNYSPDGRLLLAEDSNAPILECHSNCSCSTTSCGNRSGQFSLQFRVEPFQTADKGLGLRAAESIPNHRFLIEYSGQIVDKNEASRRARERAIQDSTQHNYIFTINEFTGNSGKCTQTFIDATKHGNLSRLINHSCNPNLFPMILRYGRRLPVLALFTKRLIEAGEELSYDYGYVTDPTKMQNLKQCRCGANNCRGFLPAYDYIEYE